MRKVNIRGYEPHCTILTRIELEHAIMTASKDPVVNDKTTVTIERQEGANGSFWDSTNQKIEASDDFTITW